MTPGIVKVPEIFQKWNFSVVLNELKSTLSAYESHRPQTSYPQTAKSGQWEKIALFPFSDFIAKNQLAREGSQVCLQ